MAYRIVHRKADGSVEHTTLSKSGKPETVVRQEHVGAPGVVIHDRVALKVGYNFHPSRSKQKREAQLRHWMDEHRKEYTHTKGWSKDRTMKHIGTIPAEIFWSARMEDGYRATHDPKNLERLLDTFGTRLSKS